MFISSNISNNNNINYNHNDHPVRGSCQLSSSEDSIQQYHKTFSPQSPIEGVVGAALAAAAAADENRISRCDSDETLSCSRSGITLAANHKCAPSKYSRQSSAVRINNVEVEAGGGGNGNRGRETPKDLKVIWGRGVPNSSHCSRVFCMEYFIQNLHGGPIV